VPHLRQKFCSANAEVPQFAQLQVLTTLLTPALLLSHAAHQPGNTVSVTP